VASLYIDEDVRLDSVPLLRQMGHAVLHARDHRKGAPDDVQMLIAARAGWITVTNNLKDFELLHNAWHNWSRDWQVTPQHGGILIARNGWDPLRIAETVNEFFTVPRPTANRLYRWVFERGWEERFPRPS
jgi:hypothetical protein